MAPSIGENNHLHLGFDYLVAFIGPGYSKLKAGCAFYPRTMLQTNDLTMEVSNAWTHAHQGEDVGFPSHCVPSGLQADDGRLQRTASKKERGL